jgi:hypothetical protein
VGKYLRRAKVAELSRKPVIDFTGMHRNAHVCSSLWSMPSRDAQWIFGTVIAIAIALSMQIGGIRADVRELRADVREDLRDMRTDLRSIGDRLRAVEQAVKPEHPAE